jgi:hypothetical protein
VRSLGNPPLLARMATHRLVLGVVAITVLIAAALAAALADFAGQGLSQAERHNLAMASGNSVTVSGTVTAGGAAAGTRAVRSAMRSAFGAVPFSFQSAAWSDALDLPGPPHPRTVPQLQAAAMGGLLAHALLIRGTWPGPPRPGQPIPGALPARAAALLHLTPGQVLTVRDARSAKPVRIRVTGLYVPRDPASPYWGLDTIGASGVVSLGGFTTYGPLSVSPGAFHSAPGQRALLQTAASWVVIPDTARIPEGGLGAVAAGVQAQQRALQNPAGPLGGLRVSTSLPAVLRGVASDLVVARSLILIGALELLILGGAALIAAARLLAERREAELSLLAARGGARWQLARNGAAEALILAALAAVAGTAAGGPLAWLLARGSPLSPPGQRVSSTPAIVWLVLVAGAVLATGIALIPVLRPQLPGLARVRRGRGAVISRVARAGADVALIALAALAVWQLREYSTVARSAQGTLGVDPVLVVAPALALVAGTAVLLRLLPLAARAGDRLAPRRRTVPGALAIWQFSRRPIRQAGPALLVVLAVATGTLALSQHQTWVSSAQDQADFRAGAQVRVDTPLPASPAQARAIAAAPGVRAAMPVARIPEDLGAQAVALDASQGPRTALLPADLSAGPARALFARITPSAVPGALLPGRQGRYVMTASLGPASLHLSPATVTAWVQDADGDTYPLTAGPFPADGRPHRLPLNLGRGVLFPARLVAVAVGYTIPVRPLAHDAMFTLTGIAAAGPGAAASRLTALRSTSPRTSAKAMSFRSTSLCAPSANAASPGTTASPATAHPAAPNPATSPRATSAQATRRWAASPGTAARPATPHRYPRPGTSPRVAASGVRDSAAGPAVLAGTELRGWSATASSPELVNLIQAAYGAAAHAVLPHATSWRPAGHGTQALTFAAGSATQFTPAGRAPVPGQLLLAPAGLARAVIPGIATHDYLAAGNLTVGSTVPLPVDGVTVGVKIVAAVSAFPTVSGPGGAIVMDLPALQDALASTGQPPVPVTEWWLAANRPPPALPGGTTVTTRAGAAAGLLSDPVSATPQQALAGVALGAALLALAGFAASVAASASERRPDRAVLSALGVSRTAQAWQLCLEELLLSGPSAVVGLALGAAGVLLLAPSVTLTTSARTPVPPVVTEFAWARAIPLTVLVAVLPVLLAALIMVRRPDPAAQLRALESG